MEEDAIKIANKRWDEFFSTFPKEKIVYDDWLDTFENEINNCKTPIIDLGCGQGNNVLYLTEKGKKVIACDYSGVAIQNMKKNFPSVEDAICFDMSKGVPFDDNCTDIVICDLSLHYFTLSSTIRIINEIKRVLKPNGLFLFRVNSINDVNYGAGVGEEIEPHLYKISNGEYKRFFDQEDINNFFADWEKVYVQEQRMKRYEEGEKVFWKCAMRATK